MKRTPLMRFRGFRRRNKFNAKPVHLPSGESFDSKAEFARWGQLQLLERAGEIASLTRQPKVVLVPRGAAGEPEIAWHADASYVEAGRTVYEDTKPRPQTATETLLFKLWRHWGPGVLRIVDAGGRLLKVIPGKNEAIG